MYEVCGQPLRAPPISLRLAILQWLYTVQMLSMRWRDGIRLVRLLPALDHRGDKMDQPLYLADLITGVFAALAMRHIRSVPLHSGRFERAFARLAPDLEHEAAEAHLRPRFRLAVHAVHGDSPAIHEALYEAAKRDLVSLDNPEFQSITLKLSPDDAARFLEHLPGGAPMYRRLADKIVSYYDQVAAPA